MAGLPNKKFRLLFGAEDKVLTPFTLWSPGLEWGGVLSLRLSISFLAAWVSFFSLAKAESGVLDFEETKRKRETAVERFERVENQIRQRHGYKGWKEHGLAEESEAQGQGQEAQERIQAAIRRWGSVPPNMPPDQDTKVASESRESIQSAYRPGYFEKLSNVYYCFTEFLSDVLAARSERDNELVNCAVEKSNTSCVDKAVVANNESVDNLSTQFYACLDSSAEELKKKELEKLKALKRLKQEMQRN